MLQVHVTLPTPTDTFIDEYSACDITFHVHSTDFNVLGYELTITPTKVSLTYNGLKPQPGRLSGNLEVPYTRYLDEYRERIADISEEKELYHILWLAQLYLPIPCTTLLPNGRIFVKEPILYLSCKNNILKSFITRDMGIITTRRTMRDYSGLYIKLRCKSLDHEFVVQLIYNDRVITSTSVNKLHYRNNINKFTYYTDSSRYKNITNSNWPIISESSREYFIFMRILNKITCPRERYIADWEDEIVDLNKAQEAEADLYTDSSSEDEEEEEEFII